MTFAKRSEVAHEHRVRRRKRRRAGDGGVALHRVRRWHVAVAACVALVGLAVALIALSLYTDRSFGWFGYAVPVLYE